VTFACNGKEGKEGTISGLSASEKETLLAVLPYIKYVPSGVGEKPTIQISGANLQLLNGDGKTETTNGAGNLILGYTEFSSLLQKGSHDLVFGGGQEFTSYADIIAGEDNHVQGPYSVAFGQANHVTGPAATVTGGYLNEARAEGASVSGGRGNIASGIDASVSAGKLNEAKSPGASVTGGNSNIANGPEAAVDGGQKNVAQGSFATVTGGTENHAEERNTSILGGKGNVALVENEAII